MARNAYLLISDLHDSHKKKGNRYNYQDEIHFVKKKIIATAQDLKADGCCVYLVFMGDVFDTGYKEIFSSAQANNFFIFLRSLCEGIYLLFGNHELTYYNGNPIYTLLKEIKSKKVRAIQNKMWKPHGFFQTIEVVDRIDDGDTVIHFNHYGTPVSKAVEGKVNVALYHQDIVCPEIVEDMQSRQRRKLYGLHSRDFDNSGIFEGIDYNFFGHMHSIYGEWDWESERTGHRSRLQYLASLGRPNYLEVNDDFLERDLPAVMVDNEKFSGIVHNRFSLPGYGQCIKDDVVALERQSYEMVKSRKQIRNYVPTSDNPIRNMRERCQNAEQQAIFDEMLETGTTALERNLKEKIREVLYNG